MIAVAPGGGVLDRSRQRVHKPSDRRHVGARTSPGLPPVGQTATGSTFVKGGAGHRSYPRIALHRRHRALRVHREV